MSENQSTQPSAAQAAAEAETASVETSVENTQTAVQAEPETTPPVEVQTQASADGSETAHEAAEAAAAAQAEEAATAEAMDKLIDQYSTPKQGASEDKLVEGRVVAIIEHGVVVDIGGKSEALIPAQEFSDASSELKLAPGEQIEVFVLNEHKDGYVLLSYLRALRRRIWENIERSYREHTDLSGKVVDLIKGGLVVDIGIRAFLPASQVDVRPTGNLEEWREREILCRVLKMNRKRGNVVVSRRALLEEELKAQREKLLSTLQEGAILKGVVKNLTDYGAFVDLGGVDGLLHLTDLSWGRVARPADLLKSGQEIGVVVLKFDKEKHRISLGHKQLTPDPWGGFPDRFPIGARVKGRVTSVTDYGAFVELEPGVEGLVHVSEMSWSKRAKHPSKMVSAGDTVEVQVLDLKPDTRRVSLGIKQLTPDPWHALSEKYPVGSKITGKIRNMTDFGAFVEIEEGFDGLIHVSDIRWNERVKHPSEVFKKGDEVEAKVLRIDSENRRLSLGVKQLNDIWAHWFEAHKLNDLVKGKVTRSVEFGVFVELGEGIEGLCHISEIEGRRPRGEDHKPQAKGKGKTTLEVGQEYDFKIVKINPDQHKIGLSYRAAVRQAERKEIQEYRSSKSSSTATIGDMILSKRNAQIAGR